MQLSLDRDLCFLDCETTGGDVVKDRIIQICVIKYPKDKSAPIEKTYLVNPTIAIKADAAAIHGFTNDMLMDKPTFKMIAVELFEFLQDADLAGYNSNRFDIPLLIEEFARVGLNLDMQGRRLIDVMQIFYKMEPRTLKAAFKFYCGQDLTDAHDATADTKATADVFFGQLEKYQNVDYTDQDGNVNPAPIKADSMQSIHEFVNDHTRVDFTARFIRNNQGEIVFNFGNNKGEAAYKHPNVLRWMLDRDFPLQVKNIAKSILNGQLK